VPTADVPEHDLLVAGFPCQDYSVATTKAEGIHGKKGVLWWEIERILKGRRPPYVVLENVDRLVKSPGKQPGRDFGVILWCLDRLGYSVEWRVVNAADYGSPQRRRRTFILGALENTSFGREMSGLHNRQDWLERLGLFARAFPTQRLQSRKASSLESAVTLSKSLQKVSDEFALRFLNAGVMCDRTVWTFQVRPRREPERTLADILETAVPEQYFISEASIETWKRLKGAKAEHRVAKNGYEYHYTEGAIPFPDPVERPSRTIMTSEGGTSPSRFKHLILDPKVGRYRVLTPIEVERLNGFPQDWTKGMPERVRYFCMGNALVVDLVDQIGRVLAGRVEGIERKSNIAVSA